MMVLNLVFVMNKFTFDIKQTHIHGHHDMWNKNTDMYYIESVSPCVCLSVCYTVYKYKCKLQVHYFFGGCKLF